jgi:hypothetical protein
MFVFSVSRKSCPFKSCPASEELPAYNIPWSHIDWCKFCIHLSTLKIPPTSYSKGPSKKIIIQTKLAGMSLIFHCAKPRLYKCNASWVVSIKQYVNFKYQQPAYFVFLVFRKNGLTKSHSSSEDLSEYKISWSYVNWRKFCIHLNCSNVRHSGMVAATAQETIASRSPSMAGPPYWIL